MRATICSENMFQLDVYQEHTCVNARDKYLLLMKSYIKQDPLLLINHIHSYLSCLAGIILNACIHLTFQEWRIQGRSSPWMGGGGALNPKQVVSSKALMGVLIGVPPPSKFWKCKCPRCIFLASEDNSIFFLMNDKKDNKCLVTNEGCTPLPSPSPIQPKELLWRSTCFFLDL